MDQTGRLAIPSILSELPGRRRPASLSATRRSVSGVSGSGAPTLDPCAVGRGGPVVIFPSSGTGDWEAALVNTLSAGDSVLMYETGQFARLWRGARPAGPGPANRPAGRHRSDAVGGRHVLSRPASRGARQGICGAQRVVRCCDHRSVHRVEMKVLPVASPISKMVQILGYWGAAAVLASRTNRLRTSSFETR